MAAPRHTRKTRAGLFAAAAIALILLFHALLAPAPPRNAAPAQWQTSSAGWALPLPERAAAAGIGADDVRYLQQGEDLRIDLRRLVVEKHPAVPELRVLAITLRVEPERLSPREAQAMEAVLTRERPALLRTTVSFIVKEGVACLQQGHCSYRIELTLREPDGRITVERSAKLAIPQRPVVIDLKK
jgi:hypothetical protein